MLISRTGEVLCKTGLLGFTHRAFQPLQLGTGAGQRHPGSLAMQAESDTSEKCSVLLFSGL